MIAITGDVGYSTADLTSDHSGAGEMRMGGTAAW